ncbi:MAG: peptidoglycan-binding protein, partial [Desulfobacterales bacterium]
MARPGDKPYGERVLKLEDPPLRGLDVWELQVKLIGWGSGTDSDGIGNVMDPVRLTSTFDATTRDAVMRFKKAHGLPVTGIADAMLMRVIDREAVLHPVLMWDLMCPCTTGVNDGDPLCRCTKHEEDGKGKKCDGFGKERFAGKYILETKKLADGTELKDEKLDVYDKEEYPGMDKTVLWAVRAILHRSKVNSSWDRDAVYKPIKVVSGYCCWWDNYHHTDDIRWHHRRSTFNLGKAIEFYIHDHCTETKWDDNVNSCPQCDAIRKAALEKCGFQSRWHEPDRVAVAEGTKDARPPATPFSVHVDTVRLHPRNADANKTLEYKDQFVKSDIDAIKPLYEGKIKTAYFPVELGEGIDPLSASSAKYFRAIEKSEGGWFPLGRSRTWHGGIHLPS